MGEFNAGVSAASHICSATSDVHRDLQDFKSFEEFAKLLIKEGYISKPSWKDEYLVPLIQTKLAHLVNSLDLKKGERFDQFLGIDFILDQEFNLWILECDTNPLIFYLNPGTWVT
jgi:hypothetical protein